MKLYVDDVREAPEGWTLARDYDEALGVLYAHLACATHVSDLSLDHDLGDGKSGYDVALWIAATSFRHAWPDHIYCHSMNPVGRENILALLERYAPDGVEVHR